ncbi:hypothetical protein [Solidesulfovibrio sp. C21]|uniref:hypothetical protein n=1 Tax=Solidesulfovibrio sp. C21 TaxID=3398613 RepID=UPI0039FB901B
MPDVTFSPRAAATQAGTTAMRVRRLCETGKIPGAFKDVRGHWCVPAASIGHITPAEREAYSEWTQHEIALLGTDTDARVGRQIGRSSEAVRDMRNRNSVEPFPVGNGVVIEQQIPRMTSERLRELQKLINETLQARAGK